MRERQRAFETMLANVAPWADDIEDDGDLKRTG